MHRSIAACAGVMLLAAMIASGLEAAERALTEEERIAPLVMKQNCWGGVSDLSPMTKNSRSRTPSVPTEGSIT